MRGGQVRQSLIRVLKIRGGWGEERLSYYYLLYHKLIWCLDMLSSSCHYHKGLQQSTKFGCQLQEQMDTQERQNMTKTVATKMYWCWQGRCALSGRWAFACSKNLLKKERNKERKKKEGREIQILSGRAIQVLSFVVAANMPTTTPHPHPAGWTDFLPNQ